MSRFEVFCLKAATVFAVAGLLAIAGAMIGVAAI